MHTCSLDFHHPSWPGWPPHSLTYSTSYFILFKAVCIREFIGKDKHCIWKIKHHWKIQHCNQLIHHFTGQFYATDTVARCCLFVRTSNLFCLADMAHNPSNWHANGVHNFDNFISGNAGGKGDPHFLNQKQYTFNGLGEYIYFTWCSKWLICDQYSD